MKARQRKRHKDAATAALLYDPWRYLVPIGYYANRPTFFRNVMEVGRIESVRFIESRPS